VLGRLTRHHRVLTNLALFLDATNFTFFAFYDLRMKKQHKETKQHGFYHPKKILRF